MTTILARTRHVYDSYLDFWRLVQSSDLRTCYVDEIDLTSDHTYVFTPMNGEMMGRLDELGKRRCKLVWWNLERPSDETLETSLGRLQGKIDAIWVSDRSYAQLDARFTYVPIAGHPGFGTRSPVKLWDVCHLAYLWGRRDAAVKQLIKAGVRIAPEAYGRVAQDGVLAHSRLVLNMHQYAETNTVAPLRFAAAASYGVPVVSEPFDDILALDQVMFAVPMARLITDIPVLLKHPEMLELAGDRLHRRMCIDTDFGREVLIASGKVRA